mmetsp:Transcript_1520/g.3655  ORF Transcript_1520/g.3655 Transcript_1520/m.3655 type:complete len:419 (-) Transcript_1520:110-1366(-)|eukprot:jgi/Tetstr1/423500/TSEL_014177.t1
MAGSGCGMLPLAIASLLLALAEPARTVSPVALRSRRLAQAGERHGGAPAWDAPPPRQEQLPTARHAGGHGASFEHREGRTEADAAAGYSFTGAQQRAAIGHHGGSGDAELGAHADQQVGHQREPDAARLHGAGTVEGARFKHRGGGDGGSGPLHSGHASPRPSQLEHPRLRHPQPTAHAHVPLGGHNAAGQWVDVAKIAGSSGSQGMEDPLDRAASVMHRGVVPIPGRIWFPPPAPPPLPPSPPPSPPPPYPPHPPSPAPSPPPLPPPFRREDWARFASKWTDGQFAQGELPASTTSLGLPQLVEPHAEEAPRGGDSVQGMFGVREEVAQHEGVTVVRKFDAGEFDAWHAQQRAGMVPAGSSMSRLLGMSVGGRPHHRLTDTYEQELAEDAEAVAAEAARQRGMAKKHARKKGTRGRG